MNECKQQRIQQGRRSRDQSQISPNLALGACMADNVHLDRNKVPISCSQEENSVLQIKRNSNTEDMYCKYWDSSHMAVILDIWIMWKKKGRERS